MAGKFTGSGVTTTRRGDSAASGLDAGHGACALQVMFTEYDA